MSKPADGALVLTLQIDNVVHVIIMHPQPMRPQRSDRMTTGDRSSVTYAPTGERIYIVRAVQAVLPPVLCRAFFPDGCRCISSNMIGMKLVAYAFQRSTPVNTCK